MTWLLLAVAITVEIGATTSLKAAGNGDPRAIIVVIVGYGVCLSLLAYLVRHLEVGVVYAIWAGAGTALVAVAGVLVLGETVTLLKVIALVLIIAGVVMRNLVGAA